MPRLYLGLWVMYPQTTRISIFIKCYESEIKKKKNNISRNHIIYATVLVKAFKDRPRFKRRGSRPHLSKRGDLKNLGAIKKKKL